MLWLYNYTQIWTDEKQTLGSGKINCSHIIWNIVLALSSQTKGRDAGISQRIFLTMEQTRKIRTETQNLCFKHMKSEKQVVFECATSCIWVRTILEINLYRHFYKINDACAWRFNDEAIQFNNGAAPS